MLYITDTSGVRIGSVTQDYKESGDVVGAIVDISARVYETDTGLSGRWVSAAIQWNDGSSDVTLFGSHSISAENPSGGFITLNATRRLLPGRYVVVLRAQNFRSPTEDVARANFLVNVSPAKAGYNPQNLLFGPILPRDSGYPNPQQWEFDTDADIAVLESSVKMLLLTSKGDRIMEPGYGTNIRRVLFDMNLKSAESVIREEIVAAFSDWEPRVELSRVVVESDQNDRSVTLNLVLVSRLNRQAFETRIQYNR
jgi:phage baseplate assembly protein W